MASFFGEVVFPRSRAFWYEEDEEEDFENFENNVQFEITWVEPEPSEIEKFVVIETKAIIDFIYRPLLQDAKSICNIACAITKSCSTVYLIDNVYICVIDKNLDLAHSGKLTEAMSPLILKSKNIFTITSDIISHFKTEEEITSRCFMNTLCSTKARDKNIKFPNLPIPNFVTGVCAGVLTYAEMSKLNCIMYILYTDTFTLDSKNSMPLVEILSELLEKTLPNLTAVGSILYEKGNMYT